MADRSPEDDTSMVTRRQLLAGAGGAVAATVASRIVAPDAVGAQTPQLAPVPRDPTKVQGAPTSRVGTRSRFEQPRRTTGTTSTQTPLHELVGTITPSDLHYERHHAGVPLIDPAQHTLTIHGMVDRPLVFSLEDLEQFPSVSRTYFLECAGNYRRNAPEETTAQQVCGLTSNSEWTGVPLATLLREAGVSPSARWFLAEGRDAAKMTRSIPVEKAFDDALIVYGQNGEALRPEQGYPIRLLCPGWEGNANIKWLQRIELGDEPFMTREETSKYTEVLKDGHARQFSFVIDARSIITSPSYPNRMRHGWNEIRGIAWSGRGKIARVDVSFDEGKTWKEAELQTPVLSKAHTRFRYLWNWTGAATTMLSRAVDETGYVQPTQRELIDARGVGCGPYHLNPVTGWRVKSDGSVVFRTEAWA